MIVAAELSDQAWADICAAAKPHTPDADARAVLSKVLFEDYPGFTYDRELVATATERAKCMLENLAAFEADYRAQFVRADDGKTTPTNETERNAAVKTERDLLRIEDLRRRTADVLLDARTQQHHNDRRRNVQRGMLYHWLCGVWLDHFHGELTYSRPTGEPSGPLVEFILMAMRQIMPEDELPKRETLRNTIDRERNGREDLRQQIASGRRKRGMVV